MSRGDGSIDPHLDLKIGLFFVAAALGIGGMIFGQPMMIFAAMVVIGVGLLLRYFGKRPTRAGGDTGAGGEAGGGRDRDGGGDPGGRTGGVG